MKTLKYKGYEGTIEISEEDDCLIGEIIGINGIVRYDGESLVELRAAFEEAVDDFISWSEEHGHEVRKNYSGNYALRMPPSLHADAALAAARSDMSLNEWLNEQVKRGIRITERVNATTDMVKSGVPQEDAVELHSTADRLELAHRLRQAANILEGIEETRKAEA